MKGIIPFDGTGFIMSSHFSNTSNYTIIEIIAFENIKQFIQENEGVIFYSDGYKIFFLYEPVNYRFRFQEPYLREQGDSIPLRWNELEILEMPNHDRLLITREPYSSMGTFYVSRPASGNFTYYFYDQDQNASETMGKVLSKVLNEELKTPRSKMPEVLKVFEKNLDFFRKNTAQE